MDHNKNTNNPDLTDSPKPSNIDSMIQQFQMDINKKPAENCRNTRTLTVNPDEPTPDKEIEKQITELEDIIKLLQKEIKQMSLNADIRAYNEYSIVEHNSSLKMHNTVGHVYPLIYNGVGMNLNEQSQVKDEDEEAVEIDHMKDVTKNFTNLVNDETSEDSKELDIDRCIDNLIAELQSEVNGQKFNEPEEAKQNDEK